jgi:hypothetical protein
MARVIDGRSELSHAIKGQIYDALRESLTKPQGNSKTPWANQFIQEMLKEAKKNPNSAIGQIIAKQLMSEDIISKLDAETDKYLARDRDFALFRIMNTLYKEQRDVFLDKYRKKIAICSRRVGKTELAARLLLSDMIYPDHHAVFISMKFENGIRQCYPIVEELAGQLGFEIEHSSKSEGEIAFSNGSNILFKGNNNKAEADKLLGYKFSYAIIDESQNQVNLMYLLDTVLRPAMIDYEDSRIVMLGTPPRAPKSAVEVIWNEYKEWHHYNWDLTKNPYIPNPEQYIADICRDKGITEDAPFIQRELKGLWSYDTEAQVFKGYKTYTDIPKFPITNIYIGNDYGWNDYNAIIGVATNNQTKQGYVFYEKKFNKSTVTDIINANKAAIAAGKQILVDNNADITSIGIYGDTSDKSIIYEMSQTHNLPAYCCYKYDKANAIVQLGDYCRSGQILIPKDGILDDEFQRTLYKRNEDDTITSELDDDVFHPDAVFAFLYASRQWHFDWTGSYNSEEEE